MPKHARRSRDEGSALILTIMVLALVGVLATTMAAVTTTNLEGSNRAVASATALNMSDAAISQAVSYMRTNNVIELACSPTCLNNPWGNSATPAKVTVSERTGRGFTAWIEPIAKYPEHRPGRYRVHAVGTADNGSAVRTVTADIDIDRFGFPLGIAANELTGAGASGVVNETMIVTGCVYRRNQIKFSGSLDPAYGIPPGVHSARYITDKNGSGPDCPASGSIHDATDCNASYPHDQDAAGGPNGSPCAVPGNTSLIKDVASLYEQFDLTPGALTVPQIEALRGTAQLQRNYYTNSQGWLPPTQQHAVLFFDLTATNPGGLVDLATIPGYDRDTDLKADDPRCVPQSLVIVILGGNMRLASGAKIASSIFLISPDPYGVVKKANGSSVMTGSVFANNIDMAGTTDWHMDECFTQNVSPHLFDVEVSDYAEIDR